ncbi:MAG: hypothetical protein HY674_00740, partial [Chloroflexi bacterium]|nr:hypothetical protein [Chloroflexota bacterium]
MKNLRRINTKLVSAFLQALMIAPILAQETPLPRASFIFKGAWFESIAPEFLGQWISGVTISGDYAYLTDWAGDPLRVLDISNPASPKQIASVPNIGNLFSDFQDIALEGQIAYVAAGQQGLEIFDISNPANLQLLAGPFETSGWASAVAISGKYAYLIDEEAGVNGKGGLRVIDVTDPANPLPVGNLVLNGKPADLAVSGDFAYVATSDNGGLGGGLQVIDVSDPTTPKPIGRYEAGIRARAVAVAGKHAFLSIHQGDRGELVALDISDRANPERLASYAFAAPCCVNYLDDVQIAGNYAYLAKGESGLEVLDISNPANPQSIGAYDTVYAEGLAIRDNQVFVADGYAGLKIFEVKILYPHTVSSSAGPNGRIKPSGSATVFTGDTLTFSALPDSGYIVDQWLVDGSPVQVGGRNFVLGQIESKHTVQVTFIPEAPTIHQGLQLDLREVGQWSTGQHSSMFSVAARGNLVYLGRTSGLEILDMIDPANPKLLGRYNRDSISAIAISGNHAYLSIWSFGLEVIDVSDPANPSRVGVLENPQLYSKPAISGNYAYFGAWDSLLSIDISDPSNPRQVGSFAISSLKDVAVVGYYAYVSRSGAVALEVIDISDPIKLKRVGSWNGGPDASRLAVSGNYAFLSAYISAEQRYVIHILDITDPTMPQRVAGYNLERNIYDITISGNYAYLAGGLGLEVLDITNPLNPRAAGRYEFGGGAIALSGNHAYRVAGEGGLHVLNITNPADPQRVAIYQPRISIESGVVTGDFAYLAAGYGGLQILDVRDPDRIHPIGKIDTLGSYVRHVALSGNLAYAAAGVHGLHVIDITNPANPKHLGTYDTEGSAWEVALLGSYAYVADQQGGLQVIDVSNPAAPKAAGAYKTSHSVDSVAVAGQHVFIASPSLGCEIVEVTDPANPRRVGRFEGWIPDLAVSGHNLFLTLNGGMAVFDVSHPAMLQPIG